MTIKELNEIEQLIITNCPEKLSRFIELCPLADEVVITHGNQRRYERMKKIKETIIYLLNKMPGLTMEQIAWVLFKIDMEHYGHHGKPFFEGISWIKTKNGVDFIESD